MPSSPPYLQLCICICVCFCTFVIFFVIYPTRSCVNCFIRAIFDFFRTQSAFYCINFRIDIQAYPVDNQYFNRVDPNNIQHLYFVEWFPIEQFRVLCRHSYRIEHLIVNSIVFKEHGLVFPNFHQVRHFFDRDRDTITVSPDGSTGYASIGAAIAYAQTNGYSVVNILAGTYTENVIISKTAAVTVVGETTSGSSDYSANLVTISNGGGPSAPLTFNTAAGQGVAWKNINFINTNSSSTAGLVYLRGSKNAFYSCAFTSTGSVGFTGSYASGIIANSYLEAADKVISSYASLYIYGSTITATNKNALIVYNKGAAYGLARRIGTASTLYNSTVVLDNCNVIQKTGYSNTNVFLAAANGVGSVVVYRDTTLAGFIAGSGVHVDPTTQDSRNEYIEFGTSGAGGYSNYVSTRAAYVSWVTDVMALSAYKISVFFTTCYPTVALKLFIGSNALHVNNFRVISFLVKSKLERLYELFRLFDEYCK
ncbi:hypothetical protein Hte_006786 [Hypoxylon texense]